MSISNKTFKNNKTGETIKVIDSFEDIAVLENKGKEKVSNLLNPDLYTEQIDPSNFFNTQGAYNNLAEKIKNIPTDKIRDDISDEVIISVDGSNTIKPAINESAIIMTTEEDERAELARKYGAVVDTQSDLNKQNEAFNKLLNPESPNQPKAEVIVNNQVKQEDQREVIRTTEDPIITMFKNVKRIKEFSISLEIKNKIPRPDFIEMMEDSYNTSIIDFLASEFTNNLLKNPQIIEDMIKQKIKEVVYTKKENTSKDLPRSTRKTSRGKKTVNSNDTSIKNETEK